MSDLDMDEALQSFRNEAQELFTELEACLLRLEDTPTDSETLNSLFRTVHTIKGTAGLFGMRDLVGFTHQVETVLDNLREGKFVCDAALSSLLLSCKDQIQALLDLAMAGDAMPQDLAANGSALLAQLLSLSPVEEVAAHGELALTREPEPDGAAPASAGWRIRMQFGESTFADGFDPLSTLGYLASLGEVAALSSHLHEAGEFEQADPELCRLTFDLTLHTDAPRERIDAAFTFVLDTCQLSIEPLQAAAAAPAAAKQALTAAPASSVKPVTLPAARNDGAAVVAASARHDENRMVRVAAEKLDQLINLVGELVIAGSGTGSLASKHRIKELVASTTQLNGLIEEIRDRALSLRMVAIGETFNRFKRVVRDLSNQLDKQVELVLEGVEAELDKSMVERLNDPLVHIVRNALDHGIEMPDARVAAGKPAAARLVLAARHEAGAVVITVSDDGAGLNRERILAKAIERGLVAPNAQLRDDEICDLVFAPGFSTAAAVTDLSGRGVGMDVVRRAIEDLRGTVRMRSVPGQGTAVEMRLPLTLAIIDGFHVRVGHHLFVLPLKEVVECINTRHMAPPEPGAVTGHMSLRGSALPVLHLRELFELDGPTTERQSIVVVRSGEAQVGLVMDTLMGEGQTVIKPMSELFTQLEGIAGSTVLGTGDVALILDVPALVALAGREESRKDKAVNQAVTA